MEFDKDAFLAIYPGFSDVPDAALTFVWQSALLLSGLETNPNYNDAEKENLLFHLMCHMLELKQRGTAGAMVGATEGSVSVSYTSPPDGMEEWWYTRTACGSYYWEVIKGGKFGGMWFNGCHC
jgi:hypothetical protein